MTAWRTPWRAADRRSWLSWQHLSAGPGHEPANQFDELKKLRPERRAAMRTKFSQPDHRHSECHWRGAVLGLAAISFSISSITLFISFIVRSRGSSEVMSTPASFKRSIGYFEPPAPRNARYLRRASGSPAFTFSASAEEAVND